MYTVLPNLPTRRIDLVYFLLFHPIQKPNHKRLLEGDSKAYPAPYIGLVSRVDREKNIEELGPKGWIHFSPM
ncbi:Uncharacterized protein TCM_015531 [Theobroma cacao]|uniref:Uncharacterized protein n=1 Tax=Theobroma cacao TaxID=3641 RepID=A0A061G2E3_THECC|nr:Uncharacterized protein TCM_015531 [Theobroma cacao]